MPGQYLLYYYSDSTAKKLKGVINLDSLEQVDSGLTFESGKVKYQYMFDIKTPKRVYYLAADSEQAMSEWVECVCQVCGLRPYQTPAEEAEATAVAGTADSAAVTNQPPARSSSVISGPYMHLSECFTGSRPPIESHVRSRLPAVNDSPGATTVLPAGLMPRRSVSPTYQNDPPPAATTTAAHHHHHHLSSPLLGLPPDESLNCGDDSVFLPSSPPAASCHRTLSPPPAVRAPSEPVAPEPSGGLFSKLKVSELPASVPGRPPKPPSLRNFPVNYPSQPAGDTYANHEDMQRVALVSKMEAAAFSLQENNNNTPGGFLLSAPHQQQQQQQQLPLEHPAPQIDRRLKPFRKGSLGEATTMPSSARTTAAPAAGGGSYGGPPVERALKPRSGSVGGGGHFGTVPRLDHCGLPSLHAGYNSGMVHPLGGGGEGRFRNGGSDDSLPDMDSRRNSVEEEQIYYYMPSLQHCQGGGGRWDPLMIPAQEMLDSKIQYLDLDLPAANSLEEEAAAVLQQQQQHHPGGETSRDRDTATVYKTVDFIKTEAFNRTRINVEENRSKMNPD